MKNQIIDQLIDLGAVKFGEFTLKSGMLSPFYIDLRMIVSSPELLQNIAVELCKLSKPLRFDRVAGIPYTALPMATAFSIEANTPMIYARKEQKAYGTKKQIEGIFHKGETVLILDDLITNGESKFETFAIFESENLKVQDVVVLIDRMQGGKDLLESKGYNLYSVININEILDRVLERKVIDQDLYQKSLSFVKETGNITK